MSVEIIIPNECCLSNLSELIDGVNQKYGINITNTLRLTDFESSKRE